MTSSIYGFMPQHNPNLGTFQHAPSAPNARSKYFHEDMTSVREYSRQKSLRHNPYTGQFHQGPKRYSHLHNRYRTFISDADVRFESGDKKSSLDNLSSCNSSVKADINQLVKPELILPHLDVMGQGDGEDKDHALDRNYELLVSPYDCVPAILRGRSSSETVSNSHIHELQCCSPCSAPTNLCNSSSMPNHGAQKKLRSVGSDLAFSRSCPGQNLVSTDGNAVRFPKVSSLGNLVNCNFFGNMATEFLPENFAALNENRCSGLKKLSRSSSDEELGTRLRPRRCSLQMPFLLTKKNFPKSDECSSNGPSYQNLTQRSAALRSLLSSCNGGAPLSGGNSLPWIINRTVSIKGKYKIDLTKEGCLGRGTYSFVNRCFKRATGEEYCVKIINKRLLVTQEEKDMIEREVKIHQVLVHRFIIRLHEIFEDETRLFLVIEPAYAGTLAHLLNTSGGKLPEIQCQQIFKQLMQAVMYLHDSGVLQGDIKPENLLLTLVSNGESEGSSCSLNIKLCDFGLSRKVPDVKYYKYTGDVNLVPFTSMCGTMGYMAPEILLGEDYSIAVDIWAAGIVLYEILGGVNPFIPYADCPFAPLEFPRSAFGKISSNAPALLSSLLEVNPLHRIGAKLALESEWVETSFATLKGN